MKDQPELKGIVVPAPDGPEAQHAAAEALQYMIQVDERLRKENKHEEPTREDKAA